MKTLEKDIVMTYEHGKKYSRTRITMEDLQKYFVEMHASLGNSIESLMSDRARLEDGETIIYYNGGRRITFTQDK